MSVQQRTSGYPNRMEQPAARTWVIHLRRAAAVTGTTAALLLALLLLGASRPSPAQAERAQLVLVTDGETFSITRWMAAALLEKWEAAFTRPASNIQGEDALELVTSYLAAAGAIRDLEREIASNDAASRSTDDLEALAALRREQAQNREAVEQIIERQISEELVNRGITAAGRAFPPVQFSFSEPPQKFVVSPRDRIETHYYRMVEPTFDIDAAEAAEARIADEFDLSGYVTKIGGMGAFPTMVVESPSLPWVFSTVAHEWTHNYLTLHPLGLSYTTSPEMTIINETVAEIVGNEIGAAVVRRYYPEFAPPEPVDGELDAPDDAATAPESALLPPSGPTPFDFQAEMRRTRLTVDRLLAEGRIELAEAYMEQQRRKMVAHGYPLRKLNQAYFAFHGSYGTSAASSDPIAPRLFALRDATRDIDSFLQSVRGIMSVEDLEATLEAYGITP